MKKVISLLLVLSFIIVLIGCTKEDKKDNNIKSNEVSEKIEQIFKAKNPYIGDNSADANLIDTVFSYYSVNEKYTIELDTESEPYTLAIHFEKEPNQSKVFNSSVVILSLIENCNKVIWDYEHEEENQVFYITEKKINKNLGIKNIKEYNTSSQSVSQLIKMLEENKIK